MNEIVLVRFDEWEGLYLNGRRVKEHHHVEDLPEFLAQHQPYTYRNDEGDDVWLSEWGSYLPEDLAWVKVLRRGTPFEPPPNKGHFARYW